MPELRDLRLTVQPQVRVPLIGRVVCSRCGRPREVRKGRGDLCKDCRYVQMLDDKET